jgi:hypothetical protein
VIEVIFYGWVAAFMAFGLFPRRIDAIILIWLAVTFANELTIDAPIMEKLFMADDSGFFAVGLLIYEHYRGRRDARLWGMMVLATGTAAFQAVHKLERLGVQTHGSFNPNVVAAICIVSLAIVFLATRIKRVPLPAKFVMAAGGITYPLYLLHMQLGYVIFTATSPHRHAVIVTGIIIAEAVFLAWIIWRFLEPRTHSLVKIKLTEFADRLGWFSSRTKLTVQ